jgi:hypothetical protein
LVVLVRVAEVDHPTNDLVDPGDEDLGSRADQEGPDHALQLACLEARGQTLSVSSRAGPPAPKATHATSVRTDSSAGREWASGGTHASFVQSSLGESPKLIDDTLLE